MARNNKAPWLLLIGLFIVGCGGGGSPETGVSRHTLLEAPPYLQCEEEVEEPTRYRLQKENWYWWDGLWECDMDAATPTCAPPTTDNFGYSLEHELDVPCTTCGARPILPEAFRPEACPTGELPSCDWDLQLADPLQLLATHEPKVFAVLSNLYATGGLTLDPVYSDALLYDALSETMKQAQRAYGGHCGSGEVEFYNKGYEDRDWLPGVLRGWHTQDKTFGVEAFENDYLNNLIMYQVFHNDAPCTFVLQVDATTFCNCRTQDPQCTGSSGLAHENLLDGLSGAVQWFIPHPDATGTRPGMDFLPEDVFGALARYGEGLTSGISDELLQEPDIYELPDPYDLGKSTAGTKMWTELQSAFGELQGPGDALTLYVVLDIRQRSFSTYLYEWIGYYWNNSMLTIEGSDSSGENVANGPWPIRLLDVYYRGDYDDWNETWKDLKHVFGSTTDHHWEDSTPASHYEYSKVDYLSCRIEPYVPFVLTLELTRRLLEEDTEVGFREFLLGDEVYVLRIGFNGLIKEHILEKVDHVNPTALNHWWIDFARTGSWYYYWYYNWSPWWSYSFYVENELGEQVWTTDWASAPHRVYFSGISTSATDEELVASIANYMSGDLGCKSIVCTDECDQDGLADDVDNCPCEDNLDQLDGDEDGVGDACDNCLWDVNTDQANTDADEWGDTCDSCPEIVNETAPWDYDGDGYGNECDNCEFASNADQLDTDEDEIGDTCDLCATGFDDSNADYDFDGVGDVCDNCPDVHNIDQTDTDTDGIGDVCAGCVDGYFECVGSDPDGYGHYRECVDGVWEDRTCGGSTCSGMGQGCVTQGDPSVNPCIDDADHDGLIGGSDLCPCVPSDGNNEDSDNDGHGNACDNCPDTSNSGQTDTNGNGVGDACEATCSPDGSICYYGPDDSQVGWCVNGECDACVLHGLTTCTADGNRCALPCNGVSECSDGADEFGCPNCPSFTCAEMTCANRCDGLLECFTGADEMDCDTCIPGEPGCPIGNELCANQIDDNGNGLVDCNDPICQFSPACIPQPGSCVGLCGGAALNCACDQACVFRNDCCPDYQPVCVGFCGDKVTNNGEACDDGPQNGQPNKCNLTCTGPTEWCGDGIKNQGAKEACDDGAMNGQQNKCDAKCEGPTKWCGDGIKNGNEKCDDGGQNGQPKKCNAQCSGPTKWCGDAIINNTEACDDGELANGQQFKCNATCTGLTLFCGDGITSPEIGETCDNAAGNGMPGNCNETCNGMVPGCGDGNVDAGEQCDDGNIIGGDGCTADCQFEGCVVDADCDDANECTIDTCIGGECSYQPDPICEPYCGDGNHDINEFCDDGANNGNPGWCNVTCDATLPSGSCVGNCGGNAGDCFCDEACLMFGDCCVDYVPVCL